MSSLNNFNYSAADWRKTLRQNNRRTKIVIGIFILIYTLVGLVVDLYIHKQLIQFPLKDALIMLLTFKVIPMATLIMGGVAIISIFITFAFHDKIILFGTDYYEVNSNTARSIEEQQLYNVVSEMKIAAGLRYMPRVFIIDAEYMNAFASGYSEKSALIAITNGLLRKLERSELQAVIAHELSHIRHLDIKLTLMTSVLSNIMLIVINMLFYNVIFSGGDNERRRDNDALVMIIFLLRFLLPLLTVILLLYLSRTREYMADAGSVELTRDNTPLAKALLKISSDHEDNQQTYAALYGRTAHEDIREAAYIFDPAQAGIQVQKSIAGLFSTHPAIEDRLKALGFTQK
jgi:heat shock protein HtpX